MRAGLTPDGVILVVWSKENLAGVLEVINWGVVGEKMAPNKENEVQEEPELDFPAVSSALGVPTRTEVRVEVQLEQVNNMSLFGVGGGGSIRHDGLDDTKGRGLLSLGGGVLDPIGFELMGKAPVQSGVSLGIGGLPLVGDRRPWLRFS